MKLKDRDSAKKLLKKFYTLPIDDRYTFEKIRIKYIDALIDYTSTKDSTELQSLLSSIKNLGLDQLYSDLKFGTQQIFKLY